MNSTLEKAVKDLVSLQLDNAEKVWKQHGSELIRASLIKNEMLDSNIPGIPLFEKPVVAPFIAMMVDMRESTKHLMQANKGISQLERVFYETNALLPTLAKIISYHDGQVTEYLGDGALALFPIKLEKPYEQREAVALSVYEASLDSLHAIDKIINVELKNRYQLPPLVVGIGLALSKCLVTNFDDQVKAFGEAVFRVSKLCKGNNKILVNKNLELIWPSSKRGKIKFIKQSTYNDEDSYMISKTE